MAVDKAQCGDQVGGVAINDIVVITEQGDAIADITPPPDGTDAGTAVNSILAALRAHGLIATS